MEFKKEEIIEWLKGYNEIEVDRFANYCVRITLEKEKKTGKFKNPFMQSKKADALIDLYKRVANEWLIFDWVHITLQSTGISYDYVAYKNKMLLVYPETIIDSNLVYEWDDFKFEKKDWKVTYIHNFNDPFWQTDNKIKWWYCIIKNERWEFITLLSKADFEKHKAVAKWDFIWKNWYKEMCLKTLLKKAVKYHYEDIYTWIEEEDNRQYDLEKVVEIDSNKQEENLLNKYADLWK